MKNDGGQAFPRSRSAEERARAIIDSQGIDQGHWHVDGMTLRDYFAAKAMAVFLVNTETTVQQDAHNAYKMADAMLEARNV